ncbi:MULTISPECIES: transglycosylase domain-containing protein [unclassified Streptomyces]|uniref:transglycosylase domain-containing protein n=1 Tax=unclassified Streptomyces TaxID=2593676 RepID=UPI00225675D2|nr:MULTISPECIES: transglycosylase domain-containing protein [unclassified Streptomyces]WSP55931.1 penicillin-binding protein [Streptomyces sp. NBC_01241]WSU23332.1 penicillin-binding protein [Streptomyces sp. NBC_01108]MCX4787657.1 penicillin-binding protein [Streptomyces sp. NBC_01221]WSJ37802.1 penicillin-binding protein [Streptomyces sp. NBC_01321]WSP64204.1 penicillin-binding protein [Streptomyces sp. NBC_01240]
MPKKRSGGGLTTTQQAAKFLGVAALSGVVLAGIALPAAGALGLATKGTVEGFDEIPANLQTPPLSQRTTILDSKGGMIASVYSRDRTVVELKDISPYMQKAIVAIEDARFYKHGAVDLKGILRALNRNVQSGGTAQGASTLTQQYVKNVFVEEAGDDPDKVAQATQQTLGRKIQELKYAIQVEEKLGKTRILTNYLNITFFGQQAYGVEAASQRYFSKSAKDLTLEDAAMLAGIVQSPSRYDPVNDPAEATKRRNTVLQRMADVGDVTQAEADKAKATPIKLKVKKPKNGCITAVSGAGFFCDYVRNVFLTDPAFGKTKEDRAKIWNRGGLTIRTTLDPQSQQSVQASIKSHVYKSDKVATAVTLVQPGTGKIMGMGQSKPYGFGPNETQYNYSVNKDMGGSNFGFPTGSTFKPFVAAAAIAQGKPATQVYSSPYEMPYPSMQTCDKPYVNLDGARVPNEDKSEHGPYALKEAMAKSVNTYFIQMVQDIGLCPVTQMTDKLGVVQGNGEKLPQSPAIALGSKGLSPLTMASAYAAFANRGTYCTPVAIESVRTADGTSLPVPKTSCSQAMTETTADTINTLLRGVVDSGTGQQAGLTSRDNAGKTGTTDFRKNAWFVGYTPNMSGAVWVGSPTQTVEMVNITIGGVYQAKVYGGQVPGPIWRDAMTGALNGVAAPSFNTVDIPDPQKDRDDEGDRGRPGAGGAKPGKPGKKPGDKNPFPGISIPPNMIGGNTGGHRGQTNGGTQGP